MFKLLVELSPAVTVGAAMLAGFAFLAGLIIGGGIPSFILFLFGVPASIGEPIFICLGVIAGIASAIFVFLAVINLFGHALKHFKS